MALLRKHIAEAFRQFERVDAMVPPPQGRTDTDAECADMHVPRAAYSSEMRRPRPTSSVAATARYRIPYIGH
ncbi:hypothetical protein [Burkholderia ubonensis]|uniref:hypothetical protein n=1 Tax=Burkholderia ubonensis TaxID=101571 RepID=UPI0018DF0912|nr:hypothetical protein [Burkholderia ubonensis]